MALEQNDLLGNEEDESAVAEVALSDDVEIVIADDEEEKANGDDKGDDPGKHEAGEGNGQDAQAEVEEAASDEGTEADADDAGEEDDPELKQYGKAVRKRIQREIRLRKKVEGVANQVVAYAQTKEQELAAAQTALAETQKAYAEVLVHALNSDIKGKVAELRAAKDAGDMDKELAAQGEIDELRFRLNKVNELKATLPDKPTTPAAQQPPQKAAPAQPPLNPKAQQWLDKNKTWLNDKKYAAHRAFVLQADAEVAADGFDQGSDEYYRELDRRIDETFPTLRKKPVAQAKTTAKQPVAPVAAAAPAGKPAGNKVVLTKQDLATMQLFGLDPANKEHLRSFARSKQAAQ